MPIDSGVYEEGLGSDGGSNIQFMMGDEVITSSGIHKERYDNQRSEVVEVSAKKAKFCFLAPPTMK